MSHSAVRPGGWALNQKMLSSEVTQMQARITASLDKTTAGDIISGTIELRQGANLFALSGSTVQTNVSSLFAISGSVSGTSTSRFSLAAGSHFDVTGSARFLNLTSSANTNISGLVTIVANDLTISGSTHLLYHSRSITRVLQSTPAPHCSTANTADWDSKSDGNWFHTRPLDPVIGGPGVIYHPLNLPHGQLLTAISVYIQGAAAHAALPAIMPQIFIKKRNVVTDVVTTISNVSDPSATTALLQSHHAISATGLTETVDNSTYYYFIELWSESGANALVGTKSARCTCTVSISSQSVWS